MIPLNQISTEVLQKVAIKLNGTSPQCKNWEHLAENLGVEKDIINNFRRKENPFMELITYIGTEKRWNDANILYRHLRSIRRDSAADLLVEELANR